MADLDWNGVFSAVVTPFRGDGEIDFDQLNAHLDLLMSEGVAGFVVSGSTGEFYSLSTDEREKLFSHIADRIGGRAKVIAGTSSLNHADTLALTRHAKDVGCDGCMVLPPVYCLPTPKEVKAAIADVAEIGLPIMIYNNPARVGVGLTPGLTADLAEIPNVVAYKESARDLYAVSECYYATRHKLVHFAGLEPYMSALLSRGASGVVSTISNVCAPQVVAAYNAFHKSDMVELSRNQQVIDQIYHLLARSGLSNFAFVKCAMKALGRPGGEVRRPHLDGDSRTISDIGKEIGEIYERAGLGMPTK